jgi:acyl carrier protein
LEKPSNQHSAFTSAILIAGLGLGLLLLLGFFGWIASLIVVACWHHPASIPVYAAIALAFAVSMRVRNRVARREVERFQWRRPTADETFLEQIDIDPASPQAAVALTARRVFAELGGIPQQSVHGADRFYPDFQKLPFYDSIDSLHIIFTLEKSLSIRISQRESERLLKLIIERQSATVAEATREVVAIWNTCKEPHGAESEDRPVAPRTEMDGL